MFKIGGEDENTFNIKTKSVKGCTQEPLSWKCIHLLFWINIQREDGE